jgi:DNA-binding MarR family transcriptional regulator
MASTPTVLMIWRNLHLADAMICEKLNATLAARVGCSLLEHDLLAWLSTAPSQRLRMAELAGLLRVTPGGLTRIADRAAERGWIQRDRPPGNRREVHAVLTSAGQKILRAARPHYAAVLQETIATQFEDADLTALLGLSQKLLDHLHPRAAHCR